MPLSTTELTYEVLTSIQKDVAAIRSIQLDDGAQLMRPGEIKGLPSDIVRSQASGARLARRLARIQARLDRNA